MTGNAAVSRFPASQLDARRAALADRCRVLPHLAEYLSEGLGYGNDVIALYLDAAAGIVHMIGDAPEGSDDYRVTALPARDWLLSLGLDADFADEWRGCGEFPPAAPDGPQLHVPASLFLGEADAVFAAAGLPPTPPEDLGQVQGLAAALVELVDTYPTDSPAAPVYPLTLTDPASGRARTILLQPGQVAWLAELVRAELTTCHEAQGGTGTAALLPTMAGTVADDPHTGAAVSGQTVIAHETQ